MISIFEGVSNVDRLRDLAVHLVPLPRPRRVTLCDGEGARIIWGFGFFALWCGGWIVGVSDGWSKNDPLGMLFCSVPIVLLVGAILWEIRQEINNQKLVENGEHALATITLQAVRGRGNRSTIEYAFADRSGGIRVGEGCDLTKRYREKMIVPVFYDLECRWKHVAICCTRWTVDGLEPEQLTKLTLNRQR
jgi:hypothetical protein